jgi:hypothetical protein
MQHCSSTTYELLADGQHHINTADSSLLRYRQLGKQGKKMLPRSDGVAGLSKYPDVK